MPAPKAVLRDIHDLGLDPSVPFTVTGKDGRLTANPKPGAKHTGIHINQRTLSMVEPELSKVEVTNLPLLESTKEEAKVETMVESDVDDSNDDVTIVASSKKSKKTKSDKAAG
jgi:hypothetical protein